MPYQIYNMTDITTPLGVLQTANAGASNYLFVGLNFLIFGVMFITLAGAFGWEAGLLTASFLGLILGILFLYLGLVPMWMVGGYVGLIIIMIAYIIWSNRYD